MTPHKSLNCSKGVVRNWEPILKKNVPIITYVQRIVVKRTNTEIKTNTLILIFNTPKMIENLLF